jgi:nuclear pore complex protein Nup54
MVDSAKGGRETGVNGTEWTVVDEEGLAQIAQVFESPMFLVTATKYFYSQILTEQQTGLQHLTKILQRDLKDLAIIQGKEVEEDSTGTFFSSTSTLRASTLW